MPNPEEILLYQVDRDDYTGLHKVKKSKEDAFLKNVRENVGGQARLVNQETGVLYELEEKKAREAKEKEEKARQYYQKPTPTATTSEAFPVNTINVEDSELLQRDTVIPSETVMNRQGIQRERNVDPTNTLENIRAKRSAKINPTIESGREKYHAPITKGESKEIEHPFAPKAPNIHEGKEERDKRIAKESKDKLDASRTQVGENLDELYYLNIEANQINLKIAQGQGTERDEKRRDAIRLKMIPLASNAGYIQNENLQQLAKTGRIPQYTANYLTKDINRTVAKFDKKDLTGADAFIKGEHWENILSAGWAKTLRSVLKSVSLHGIKDEETRDEVMDVMGMLNSSNANTVNTSMFHDVVDAAMNSVSYMEQFAITGGISNVVQASTKGLVKNLSKNLFKQGIKNKTISQVGGFVGRNAPKMIAFSTLSPFTYDYVIEQAQNRAEGEDFTLDDIKGTDFVKGYAKTSIEFGVESLGGFMKLPKGIKPFDYLSKMTPQGVKTATRAIRLNSLPAEYGEEKIQEVIDIALWDEGVWSDFIDPKNNLLTLSVCALIQAPTSAIQVGVVAKDQYKNYKSLGRVSAVDKDVATKLKKAMSIPDAEKRYQAVGESGVMHLPSLDSKKAAIEYFVRGEKLRWQEEEIAQEEKENINRVLTERAIEVSYIDAESKQSYVSEFQDGEGNIFYITDPVAKGGMIIVRPIVEGKILSAKSVPETIMYEEGALVKHFTAEDYGTIKTQQYIDSKRAKEAEKANAIAQEKGIEPQATTSETLGQVITSEAEAEAIQAYQTASELQAQVDEFEAIENEVREGSIVRLIEDKTAEPQTFEVIRIEGEDAIIKETDKEDSEEIKIPASILEVQFQTKNVNDLTEEQTVVVDSLLNEESGEVIDEQTETAPEPISYKDAEIEQSEQLADTETDKSLSSMLADLAESIGIDRAILESKEQKEAIEKKIGTLNKKKKNEVNLQERSKILQEIVGYENDIKEIDRFLSQVEDNVEQEAEQPVTKEAETLESKEIEVEELTNRERLNRIDQLFGGDSHAVQNQTISILYEIASGQKFIWDGEKRGDNIKGVGQELGFIKKNRGLNPPSTIKDEFKFRLSLMSDKGATPAEFAERMAEEFGYDQQDAYNEIIETLLSITSPKKAIESLEAIVDKYADPIYDYTAEDYAELERLDELMASEKQKEIDEASRRAIKESEVALFNSAMSVGMTYDEFISYNDINLLINEIEKRKQQRNERAEKEKHDASVENTILPEGKIDSTEQRADSRKVDSEGKANQIADESGKDGNARPIEGNKNTESSLKEVQDDKENGSSKVDVARTPKEINEDVEIRGPLPAGRVSGIPIKESDDVTKQADIQTGKDATRGEEASKEGNAIRSSRQDVGVKPLSGEGNSKVVEDVKDESQAEKSKIEKLEQEANDALDEFLDAFNDFNSDNIGIVDNQAEKQAKMLIAGTKMIGAYTKLGVYKFADIVTKITQRGVKVSQELLDALKSAYGSYAYTNDEDIELDSNKDVKAFTIKNIQEANLKQETNEKETTNNDKGRSTEVIESETEAIESASISIKNDTKDVGGNKQKAIRVREDAQANIERVEVLLNEIDEKLANQNLTDFTYSTEGVMHEVPIVMLAKKVIKKDVAKFVKAVEKLTGLSLGVDKKGKKNKANINIAPAGGDVYFTLYGNKNPNIGISVYINYKRNNEDVETGEYSYSVDKESNAIWRIEEKDKPTGSNNWINSNFTAKELSNILLTGLNEELQRKGLEQEINDAKNIIVEGKNQSLTENKPINIRKNKDNSLSLFDQIDIDKPINTKENEPKQGRGSTSEHSSLGEQAPKEVGRLDGSGMDISSVGNIRTDESGGVGVSDISAIAKPNKEQREVTRKNTRNNRGEKGVNYAPKTPKARFDANIKAIKLMKSMINEGRTIASESETEILRKYSGWGGLGTYFNNVSNENTILRNELNSDEYNEAVSSLNSAYFTPTEVIDELWTIVEKLGFKGGNILESSAGIGNMLATIPNSINSKSNIEAVEIDLISGNILKLLYPDAKINIKGFEETDIKNGSVDLAITNVPFVTGLSVFDKVDKDLSNKFKNIHDYFIAKNIRKLRQGGLGVFITSNGTLDKSKSLREWIGREGESEVIGAFRLNNETFGGTKATSDIIIVQKKQGVRVNPNAIDITQTSSVRSVTYKTGKSKWVGNSIKEEEETRRVEYNRYFVEHPENMGGEMFLAVEKGETYRLSTLGLYPVKEKNQQELLKAWAGKFTAVETGKGHNETIENKAELTELKEGILSVNSNGDIAVVKNKELVPLGVNKNKVKGKEKTKVLADYQNIKDKVDELLNYQLHNQDDKGLKPLLANLNKAYDNFVKEYGHFNKNTAISFLRNDVEFPSISALEEYSEDVAIDGTRKSVFGKTAIFQERVIGFKTTPQPKTIKDAIVASMYVYGKVNVDYIAEKLNLTHEVVKQDVLKENLGFVNPTTGNIEVRYEYLSGNVREKLALAIDNNKNGEYNNNIAELEKVIPMNIPAHNIEFSLGSSWVVPKLYTDYIEERYGVKASLLHSDGAWKMFNVRNTVNEQNKLGGVKSQTLQKIVAGHELVEAILNNKTIVFSSRYKDGSGETRTVHDKDASLEASRKIGEIKDDFKDWAREQMQKDVALAEEIEKIYNNKFNSIALKEIDDIFLPERFEGASKLITLKRHQKVATIKGTTSALLLAHEVGTGKTFTLVSIAMEMRRLGTAKKPMLVVQNATVGQIISETKKLYPNAKILSLGEKERTKAGRRSFYAKIKYSDWDIIIVPQSTFDMIPDSQERVDAFIREKIDEKLYSIEAMKEAGVDDISIRSAERELEDLENQLNGTGKYQLKKESKTDVKQTIKSTQNTIVNVKKQLDRHTDDVQDFDALGIDAILIDEAHAYKKLGFSTTMTRGVKGIDPTGSKKAASAYLKVKAVMEMSGGKNVVFSTGTPISNTAAEIWTFMKYLIPKEVMKENEIYYFDDFVRNYGKIQQTLEFTTSGKFKENTRFSAYMNVPELIRIWNSVADVVLTKNVKSVSDKVPLIQTGQAQDIFLSQSKGLISIMRKVKKNLEDYEKMSGKEKKENSHIPLVMYGIAKRAAIDTRLVDNTAVDEANSKTNKAVEETLKSLSETDSYKGTVAIFCDQQNRRENGIVTFDLFQDIKSKLIAKGVSADQIMVMQSGMTTEKKERIFADVNSGAIRVIIGNTATLGTGVNIQERLNTLIHMDAPVRPMDYTQRNGRILRQGNMHKQWGKEVKVLRFGVEDSLDVTAYQMLKTKASFIDSIMDGGEAMGNNQINRVVEEAEEGLFDNILAVLSGSEYALLLNKAERELRGLVSRKKQYDIDQIYINSELRRNKGKINANEEIIKAYTNSLKDVERLFPKGEISTFLINGEDASVEKVRESILSGKINKEVNQKLEEAKKKSGYLFDKEIVMTKVTLNGVDFFIRTKILQSALINSNEGEKNINRLYKSMDYTCPILGLKEVPVSGGYVKGVIKEILENVITGIDFNETIKAVGVGIEKMKEANEVLNQRKGKAFDKDKDIKKLRETVKEYTMLMKAEQKEKEDKYNDIETNNDDATIDLEDDFNDETEETEGRKEGLDIRYRSGELSISQEAKSKLNKIEEEYNNAPEDSPWKEFGYNEKSGKQYAIQHGENAKLNLVADYVMTAFNALGYPYAHKSKAKSGTIYIYKNGLGTGDAIRISDHRGRGGIYATAYDISTLEEAREIVNETESYKDVLEAEKKQKGIEEQQQLEKETEWNSIKDDFKGQVFKENNRTYQDLEEFSAKDNNRSNIFQTKVGEGRGGVVYAYEWTEPTGYDKFGNPTNYGKIKPSDAFIENYINNSTKDNERYRKIENAETESNPAQLQKQAIQARAEELAKELNSNVSFISSDKMPKGHSKDKAYYDVNEKRTYINIDAHDSIEDAEKTVLHEVVAHEGLREMFGGEFDTFLDNVYKSVTDDVRSRIDNKAKKYNLDRRTATEEYLADLSENGFKKSPSTWGKIKQLFQDMISRLKISLNYRINDKDLSYILWKSYNAKKNTILDKANDVVNRERWDINKPSDNNSTTNALLYRLNEESVPENKQIVDEVVNYPTDVKKKEKLLNVMIDFVDAGLPIKNLIESINSQGKKVFADVYTQHQTMSSRVMTKLKKFVNTIGVDYLETVADFRKLHKLDFNDIGLFHQALFMRERTAELKEKGVQDKENDGLAGERGLAQYMDEHREDKGFPEESTPEAFIEWFTSKVDNTYREKHKKSKRIERVVTKTDAKGNEKRTTKKVLIDSENDIPALVQEDISNLKKKARTVVNFALDEAVRSGSISRKEYNEYKKSENYVPLRGWQEGESAGSDNIFQRINEVAKGRKSLANNPIPYMFSMAFSSVQFGIKNQVKQNLVTVMSLNKKSLYESVGFEEIFTWDQNDANGEFVGVKSSEDINDFNNDEYAVKESLEVTSVLLRDKSMAKVQAIKKEYDDEFKKHLLSYYVNGKKRTIYVEDKGLVLAFEKEKIDPVVNMVGVVTSGMARLMTGRNPDFVLRNVIKDFGTVMFLNNYNDDVKFKGRISKNMIKLLPTVIKGVATNQWGSENATMKRYNDWLLLGGSTGYVNSLKTLKDLEKEIKVATGSSANRIVGNVKDFITLKWVEYGAEMFENVTRFSVFVTAKEKGLTDEEALKLSKECSVNFDKKGRKTSTWSKLYAFLNPTIQGGYKIYEFTTDPKTVKKAVSTFVLLGVAGYMSALLRGMGDDKAEERSLYKRRRNIMVGGFTLPVSFDLLPPFMIGNLLYEWTNKDIGDTEFMYESMMSFTSLIPDAGQNVIGSIVSYNDKTRSLEALNPEDLTEALPTSLIPVMQLITNRNFMGGQIVPENKYKDVPQSALYKEANVNSLDKFIAKVINMSRTGFFGWNDYDENTYYVNGKKRFDISPATINHLSHSYLTGISRFWGGVTNSYSLIDRQASTGEVLSKTPVVGAFYSKPNPNLPMYKELNKLNAKYGDILERLDDAKRNSKMKERTPEERATFKKNIEDIKKEPLYHEAKKYKRIQSRVRKLNANIRLADKIGDTKASEYAKEELLKIIEVLKENNKEDK